MQAIPNIISLCRIGLAITLFFIPALTPTWLTIYFICGVSDMFDGYIARKYNLMTDVGALLDSLTDFSMLLIVFIKLAGTFFVSANLFILLIIVGLIKLLSAFVGFKKFQSLPWLHTYGNKIAGFIVFITTPFYFLYPQFQGYLLWFLGIVTITTSLEELLIIITTPTLDPNVTSIFYRKK